MSRHHTNRRCIGRPFAPDFHPDPPRIKTRAWGGFPGSRTAKYAVLAFICILAGCSGGDERPSLNLEIYEALRQSASQSASSQVERPPLTRAVLDTLEGSFMEAVLEREGQLAYLFVNATRTDREGRPVEIWRSEDNVSLALRSDVLIATRGIGGDLISSSVRQHRGSIGPDRGQSDRTMTFLGGDNAARKVTFNCTVADAGPATITIVGRSHRTRRIQETCSGPDGAIRNDYWIDSHAGLAWQSRQWAGPEVGYIRLRRLTNNQ